MKGSIHPDYFGIEAGLSAVGDIFEAIARRAGTTVAELSSGLEQYKAGSTGLLRMSWDNGDRTVLVNAELGGVTLGWTLTSTPADELFAAIEGTAFHTRIILERMAEYGVPIHRVINGGGVPQRNEVLNRVYANVFNMPVLVPAQEVTSLGSAIFALPCRGNVQDHRRGARAPVPLVPRRRTRPARSGHLRAALPSLSQTLFRPRPPWLGTRGHRRRSARAARHPCKVRPEPTVESGTIRRVLTVPPRRGAFCA